MKLYKFVEKLNETRPTILKNGVILAQILPHSPCIKVFLDNGITWEKKLQTKHYPYYILEGDNNTIIVYYDNNLEILDNVTGETLAHFETGLIHLENSFFIRFERNEGDEVRGFVKILCYFFDTEKIEFMWGLNSMKRGVITIFKDKNIVLIDNGKELICFSLSNGNNWWQLDFNNLLDSENVISFFQKIIVRKSFLFFPYQ